MNDPVIKESLKAQAPGSESQAPDITDDPQYQAFVESMVPHCRCRSSDVPCAGVLAGGLCDGIEDPIPGTVEYDEETELMQEATDALRFFPMVSPNTETRSGHP